MRAVVTGAAGFVGSHLVDTLLNMNWEVVGIDNLATGKRENLLAAFKSGRFAFRRLDLRRRVHAGLFESADVVFHMAADPEVRTGLANPSSQFENNILVTHNVLEAIRRSEVKTMYFASSSTVYGEPTVFPTPETYCPLSPISMYGSSKLACESLIEGYSRTFDFQCIILRLANVVGRRATHGVVPDFVAKLRKSASLLEILGDGKQSKSYVDVNDISTAILRIMGSTKNMDTCEVFNVGNRDRTSVIRIAEILCEEMHLRPAFRFARSFQGGRAWKGDVRQMLLSIEKLSRLGWHPRFNSEDSVRNAVRAALDTYES